MNIMNKDKSLDIIKYNKKLQKRLNLTINDYKEYSQFYSSIEIELSLVDNLYDKFINISDEEKDFYHIYFDNAKEEIKRNCLNKNEKVKIIKIIIEHEIKSFKKLFNKCDCISSIFFKKFYRININDMRGLFYECSSLKELNISSFNTSNVADMSYMFQNCFLLNELNISNFNTNNVTNMQSMFWKCSSLREINNFNFNIKNNTNIRYMFFGCSKEFQMKIKSQYKNIKEQAFY